MQIQILKYEWGGFMCKGEMSAYRVIISKTV